MDGSAHNTRFNFRIEIRRNGCANVFAAVFIARREYFLNRVVSGVTSIGSRANVVTIVFSDPSGNPALPGVFRHRWLKHGRVSSAQLGSVNTDQLVGIYCYVFGFLLFCVQGSRNAALCPGIPGKCRRGRADHRTLHCADCDQKCKAESQHTSDSICSHCISSNLFCQTAPFARFLLLYSRRSSAPAVINVRPTIRYPPMPSAPVIGICLCWTLVMKYS